MKFSKAMSMIEVVIALSLIGFLFTLSLNITDLSLSTTSSNKDRFIATQALEVHTARVLQRLETSLIRFGKRRFLECFNEPVFPIENCDAPDDNANIYWGENLDNENFEEFDSLKVQKIIRKNNNTVTAEINVVFLEDGVEKTLSETIELNPLL